VEITRQPDTVALDFKAPHSELNNWMPPQGFVVLDLSRSTQPGTYTIPLTLSGKPDSFSIVHIEPEQVTVTIRNPPLPEPVQESEE
jgi:YbbR domain-containing protein